MRNAWSVDQGVLILEIPVPASELTSGDSWVVIDSLSLFARRAHDEGGLADHELAPELLWNSQVTLAWYQINQNGIAGYINNVIVNGLDDPELLNRNRKATKAGLAALGDDARVQIFQQTWDLFEADGPRRKRARMKKAAAAPAATVCSSQLEPRLVQYTRAFGLMYSISSVSVYSCTGR